MNSIEKTLFLYVVEYKIFKALQGMHPLQKTCKLMSRFFGSLCAVQQNKKKILYQHSAGVVEVCNGLHHKLSQHCRQCRQRVKKASESVCLHFEHLL